MEKQRMVVGITGATGIIFGNRLLQTLRRLEIESHLVVSQAGDMTRAYETQLSAKQLRALADVSYPIHDVGAPISSGSFRTLGMVIAPCSIRSLSEISHGTTSTLLTRAADVVLKERKRLVLLVRESPLTTTHIRNMLAVTEAGGIIAPPMPAFYTRPQTIDDLVDHTIGRTLDLFGIEMGNLQRWGQHLAAAQVEPELASQNG
jgi:4-hydroxy-3-polyprenylbenzoate decarboxylase